METPVEGDGEKGDSATQADHRALAREFLPLVDQFAEAIIACQQNDNAELSLPAYDDVRREVFPRPRYMNASGKRVGASWVGPEERGGHISLEVERILADDLVSSRSFGVGVSGIGGTPRSFNIGGTDYFSTQNYFDIWRRVEVPESSVIAPQYALPRDYSWLETRYDPRDANLVQVALHSHVPEMNDIILRIGGLHGDTNVSRGSMPIAAKELVLQLLLKRLDPQNPTLTLHESVFPQKTGGVLPFEAPGSIHREVDIATVPSKITPEHVQGRLIESLRAALTGIGVL